MVQISPRCRPSWPQLCQDTVRKLQQPYRAWQRICLKCPWQNRQEEQEAASELAKYPNPCNFLAAHGVYAEQIVQILSFHDFTMKDERRFNQTIQARERGELANAIERTADALMRVNSNHARERERAGDTLEKGRLALARVRSLEFNRVSYWGLFLMREKLWSFDTSKPFRLPDGSLMPPPEIADVLSRPDAPRLLKRFAKMLRQVTFRAVPRNSKLRGRAPEKLRLAARHLHKALSNRGDSLVQKLAPNLLAALFAQYFPEFRRRKHPIRAIQNLLGEAAERKQMISQYGEASFLNFRALLSKRMPTQNDTDELNWYTARLDQKVIAACENQLPDKDVWIKMAPAWRKSFQRIEQMKKAVRKLG